MKTLLRRLTDRLTTARWWRWQTALGVAGLVLAATAILAVATNYIDERSDVANDEVARLRAQRSDYEAECRFRLNLPVTEIEGEQLDAMSDLLSALAAEDEPRAREIITELERLKSRKDQAALDRADAVETCNHEAANLYPHR